MAVQARNQQADNFSKHSRNGETPPNFVPKMTQNQSQEQVPWRPERPFWNPILEILSNPSIPYPAIRLEIESDPIHPMLTAAASSHALKTAPQRSPSGRFRNSKTPWPWRTERPLNQSQEQVPWRLECPFWNPTRNLLLSCYRARILSYPAIRLEI